MDTSRWSERAARTAKAAASAADDLKSVLRERSEDVRKMSRDLAGRSPVVVRPRRPKWQVGAMWFAAGMAMAAALGFFLDRDRGAARRRMAIDRSMATARDMRRWGVKKARHWRNMAKGTMAELESDLSEAQGSSRY